MTIYLGTLAASPAPEHGADVAPCHDCRRTLWVDRVSLDLAASTTGRPPLILCPECAAASYSGRTY